jgi:hypothetical protein
MTRNINTRKYPITRVPIIKSKHFSEQAKQLTEMGIAVTAEDQLAMWLDSMLNVLRSGGTITVADLRKAAGLAVRPEDYFFGWNNIIMTSLQIKDGTIQFPLIYLYRVFAQSAEQFDFYNLSKWNGEGRPDEHQTYLNAFVEDCYQLGLIERYYADDILNDVAKG